MGFSAITGLQTAKLWSRLHWRKWNAPIWNRTVLFLFYERETVPNSSGLNYTGGGMCTQGTERKRCTHAYYYFHKTKWRQARGTAWKWRNYIHCHKQENIVTLSYNWIKFFWQCTAKQFQPFEIIKKWWCCLSDYFISLFLSDYGRCKCLYKSCRGLWKLPSNGQDRVQRQSNMKYHRLMDSSMFLCWALFLVADVSSKQWPLLQRQGQRSTQGRIISCAAPN